MKIGIFAGAFDPVHNGHIAFAKAAMQKHGLDRLFLLPEPSPRHKQGVKAFDHRVAMAQLAVKDEPKMGVIVLDQARFTVHETWPLITKRFNDARLYMLLGGDVARRLASWPNIGEFASSAPHFVIAERGAAKTDLDAMMHTLQTTTKMNIRYSVIAAPSAHVSSSTVRATLKKGQRSTHLNTDVAKYVTAEKLYSSGDTGEK